MAETARVGNAKKHYDSYLIKAEALDNISLVLVSEAQLALIAIYVVAARLLAIFGWNTGIIPPRVAQILECKKITLNVQHN